MIDQKKKRGEVRSDEARSHCPLPEWLAVKLDVPSDMLDGGMCVELRGRNTLLIRGCQRILHYSPELLTFQMKSCVLKVTGIRLVCHSYLAGAVGVEGRVDGICLE